jgi:hypothetical protein
LKVFHCPSYYGTAAQSSSRLYPISITAWTRTTAFLHYGVGG